MSKTNSSCDLNSNIDPDFKRVQFIDINQHSHGQRLDNFLIKLLKKVPKSHIYRLIRKGEVRINGGRKRADYKLQAADKLRLAPIRVEMARQIVVPIDFYRQLQAAIIAQNEHFLVLDKAPFLPVHKGSGHSYGVIEAFASHHRGGKNFALAHRLDIETSGCLLIAKQRAALIELQQLFKQNKIKKTYLAFLAKKLPKQLKRMHTEFAANKLAISHFELQQLYRLPVAAKGSNMPRQQLASLAKVSTHTGRKHQIRIHAQEMGQPLAQDAKYGRQSFNAQCKKLGLERLFLHASGLEFNFRGQVFSYNSPLPADLAQFLKRLSCT